MNCKLISDCLDTFGLKSFVVYVTFQTVCNLTYCNLMPECGFVGYDYESLLTYSYLVHFLVWPFADCSFVYNPMICS